jgi:hypothetical protein
MLEGVFFEVDTTRLLVIGPADNPGVECSALCLRYRLSPLRANVLHRRYAGAHQAARRGVMP